MSVSQKLTNSSHHVSDLVRNVGDTLKEHVKESTSSTDESDEHHANHELSTGLAKANALSAFGEIKEAGTRCLQILKEGLEKDGCDSKTQETSDDDPTTDQPAPAHESRTRIAEDSHKQAGAEGLWNNAKEQVERTNNQAIIHRQKLKQDLVSPTITEEDRQIVERESEERATRRDEALFRGETLLGSSSENEASTEKCPKHPTHTLHEKVDDAKDAMLESVYETKHTIENRLAMTRERVGDLWNTAKQRTKTIFESVRGDKTAEDEVNGKAMKEDKEEKEDDPDFSPTTTALERLRMKEEEEDRSELRHEMMMGMGLIAKSSPSSTAENTEITRMPTIFHPIGLNKEEKKDTEPLNEGAEHLWDARREKVEKIIANNANNVHRHQRHFHGNQQRKERAESSLPYQVDATPSSSSLKPTSPTKTSCENVAISADDPEVDTVHSFRHETLRSA